VVLDAKCGGPGESFVVWLNSGGLAPSRVPSSHRDDGVGGCRMLGGAAIQCTATCLVTDDERKRSRIQTAVTLRGDDVGRGRRVVVAHSILGRGLIALARAQQGGSRPNRQSQRDEGDQGSQHDGHSPSRGQDRRHPLAANFAREPRHLDCFGFARELRAGIFPMPAKFHPAAALRRFKSGIENAWQIARLRTCATYRPRHIGQLAVNGE